MLYTLVYVANGYWTNASAVSVFRLKERQLETDWTVRLYLYIFTGWGLAPGQHYYIGEGFSHHINLSIANRYFVHLSRSVVVLHCKGTKGSDRVSFTQLFVRIFQGSDLDSNSESAENRFCVTNAFSYFGFGSNFSRMEFESSHFFCGRGGGWSRSGYNLEGEAGPKHYKRFMVYFLACLA